MTEFLLIGVWLLAAGGEGLPTTPANLDLSVIRAVPVQHDGRWMPLDTAARDLVESVTGDAAFGGRDPVALVLGWTFNAPAWQVAPLIPVHSAELRRELKLSATRTSFSFSELTSQRHLHALVDDLSLIPEGAKRDPLQKKVGDIHEKLLKLRSIFTGNVLNMIPDPADPAGAWSPVRPITNTEDATARDVASAWSAIGGAFNAGDAASLLAGSHRLVSQLGKLPAAYRPSDERITTELHYNELRPFALAWRAMLVGGVFFLAALWLRLRMIDVIGALGFLAGFALLTYGLWLRWQIAGRIPASNMFESLLFLSWGMGLFALVSMLVIRHRVVLLTSSMMGAVALMLADLLPMDGFIRPIPPVLADTIWMSIHVPIIMVSYSVLALGVLIAHAQLFVMAFIPQRRDLSAVIDSWHYWYIHVGSLLLMAGIVTGSMWAASSWGRFWGWDPKEVWSLVALLAYLTILHVRIDQERVPKFGYGVGALIVIASLVLIVLALVPLTPTGILMLVCALGASALFLLAHGAFATALKSVLAFWLIIMTYVGVNYVLGVGLHSYGFGTGAVVYYMFRIGGLDLLLVAVCCGFYLSRRRAAARVEVAAALSTP